jgi:hypothetical protein
MASIMCSSLRGGCAAAALLALAGCAAAVPSGPRVMAMPGAGKSYEAFAADDAVCRQIASSQGGVGPSEQQQINNAAVGSAVAGTALGAAAGAAIGSASGHAGGGAAVGGAMGLLAGSAIGASNANATSAELQARYDMAYSQCMAAHGNTVQAPQPAYAPYPYGPYPYGPYYYRPRYYYPY